ncbi:MAG: hypothetical protein ACK4OM_01235 [Alphaproteobacteria bacterium]
MNNNDSNQNIKLVNFEDLVSRYNDLVLLVKNEIIPSWQVTQEQYKSNYSENFQKDCKNNLEKIREISQKLQLIEQEIYNSNQIFEELTKGIESLKTKIEQFSASINFSLGQNIKLLIDQESTSVLTPSNNLAPYISEAITYMEKAKSKYKKWELQYRQEIFDLNINLWKLYALQQDKEVIKSIKKELFDYTHDSKSIQNYIYFYEIELLKYANSLDKVENKILQDIDKTEEKFSRSVLYAHLIELIYIELIRNPNYSNDKLSLKAAIKLNEKYYRKIIENDYLKKLVSNLISSQIYEMDILSKYVFLRIATINNNVITVFKKHSEKLKNEKEYNLQKEYLEFQEQYIKLSITYNNCLLKLNTKIDAQTLENIALFSNELKEEKLITQEKIKAIMLEEEKNKKLIEDYNKIFKILESAEYTEFSKKCLKDLKNDFPELASFFEESAKIKLDSAREAQKALKKKSLYIEKVTDEEIKEDDRIEKNEEFFDSKLINQTLLNLQKIPHFLSNRATYGKAYDIISAAIKKALSQSDKETLCECYSYYADYYKLLAEQAIGEENYNYAQIMYLNSIENNNLALNLIKDILREPYDSLKLEKLLENMVFNSKQLDDDLLAISIAKSELMEKLKAARDAIRDRVKLKYGEEAWRIFKNYSQFKKKEAEGALSKEYYELKETREQAKEFVKIAESSQHIFQEITSLHVKAKAILKEVKFTETDFPSLKAMTNKTEPAINFWTNNILAKNGESVRNLP